MTLFLTDFAAGSKDMPTIDTVRLSVQGAPDVTLETLLDIRVVDEEDACKDTPRRAGVKHDTTAPNLIDLTIRRGRKLPGVCIAEDAIAHCDLHEAQFKEATSLCRIFVEIICMCIPCRHL